jgi:hypothetical protein
VGGAVQILMRKASSESEIDAAFAMFVQRHAGAVVVDSDAYFTSRHEQLVALRRGMPSRRSMRGANTLSAAD